MDKHVVCYVQRKRITDWKRLVITHAEPAFIYGSNDDYVFPNELKDGGTLWVISSNPGRSPVLVAQISVEAVVSRKDPKLSALGVGERLLRHFSEFKWIAVGREASSFFGYNDAGKALLKTVFESPKGELRVLDEGAKNWRGEYGMKLQRPTKVSNVELEDGCYGYTALEELALAKQRSVFISWKWRDNSRQLIREFAYALVENGFMPWLDQLALPRARALDKVEKDQEKLEKLLRYGYRQCFAVIGIESANYGVISKGSDKNWTLREWEGELAPQKVLIKGIYTPGEETDRKVIHDADFWLSSQNPFDAAKELRNWYVDQFEEV